MGLFGAVTAPARGMASWAAESGKVGEIKDRRYLKKYLNKDGASQVDDALTKAFGKGREMEPFKAGTAGWLGGIALGMNFRLRQGEDFAPAFFKEALEDMKYGIFPELLAIQGGAAMAEAYPTMQAAASQKKSAIMNYDNMGGNYVDSQANSASRARALEQIKRHRVASLGGEARKFHR